MLSVLFHCLDQHAVEGFSDALRQELAPFSIRVSIIGMDSVVDTSELYIYIYIYLTSNFTFYRAWIYENSHGYGFCDSSTRTLE